MGSSVEGKWGIRVYQLQRRNRLGASDWEEFHKTKKEKFKKHEKCHTLFKSITYINFELKLTIKSQLK